MQLGLIHQVALRLSGNQTRHNLIFADLLRVVETVALGLCINCLDRQLASNLMTTCSRLAFINNITTSRTAEANDAHANTS